MSVRSNKKFFDELREWSERKLKILEGYLDPFVKVLGQHKQIYYVDAFAGAGVYRDGEIGSAIRAAELALRYKQQGKPYQLKCINIESDIENFENLEANTNPYGDLVLNLQGTFSDNIEQVLSEIAGSPTLFFLDPFGVKGIDWNLVHRIINRNAISDIWIRFDELAVVRLDARYGATDVGAQKSFNILCETFGIHDSAKLHREIEGNKQKAAHLYKRRLADEYIKTRKKGFVASYSIRSITEQDKYSLVFATGHIRGAIIASELVCSIEETYQREVEDYKANKPRQLSVFDKDPTEEDIFQEKVSSLAESIWIKCRGKQLSRPKVYEQIWAEWFGKIRSKHFNEAIKILQKDGRITSATGAPSNRKTAFTFRS